MDEQELMLVILQDLKKSVGDLDTKLDGLNDKFHAHCEDSKDNQIASLKDKLKWGGATIGMSGTTAAIIMLVLKYLLTGEVSQ